MTALDSGGDVLVCLSTPGVADAYLETLERVAADAGLALELLAVGADGEDVDWERVALVVALGGDGTFLEGVRLSSPSRTPLLAINEGTLGFLARVAPANAAAALRDALAGDATVVDREMLAVTGGGLDGVGINDVMVEPLPPESPTDRKVGTVHAYIDDEYVGAFEGSGLAVATPTGSTAIALSAGGPVHYPNANSSLQLTPLHAHNIGVRPVIVDSDSTITVLPADEMNVMVDGGRSHAVVDAGTELEVTGATRKAKVVRTAYDETFFDALSGEIGWGLRGVDEPGPR
jgi:myo-inositol-1(or 4)-monophosphatase